MSFFSANTILKELCVKIIVKLGCVLDAVCLCVCVRACVCVRVCLYVLLMLSVYDALSVASSLYDACLYYTVYDAASCGHFSRACLYHAAYDAMSEASCLYVSLLYCL